MERFAVFVDAGYLFAQGSRLLAGQKRPRTELQLIIPSLVDKLVALGREVSAGRELLRIYWYDAPPFGGRPQGEQLDLAFTDNIKLRLGFLNNQGQQKGVDSLIVTDLVELARNHAISDALLLSGDEDIRVGVQLAQMHGVRVHLLGIKPCRGSQSHLLLQEADTCHEWQEDDLKAIMRHDVDATSVQEDDGMLESIVATILHDRTAAMTAAQRQQLHAHVMQNHALPRELDGHLLGSCKAKFGRFLEETERRRMRTLARNWIMTHLDAISEDRTP